MKKKSRKTRYQSKEPNTAAKTYQTLVETGIGFVQRWANAASIPDKNLAVLGAVVAFVESTFIGTKSAQVRRQAMATALRAAYLYGRLDGKLPKKKNNVTA
jgi:hypothetical protein